MAYRKFALRSAATVATVATVPASAAQSVANVATVAAPPRPPGEYANALCAIVSMQRPDGISPERWQTFRADAETLVTRWGAEIADLGFTAAEMLASPDSSGHAGFAWHLRGRPLVNIEGGVFHVGEAPKDVRHDA